MSMSHKNTPEEDEQDLERLLAIPTYAQLEAKCTELERQVADRYEQGSNKIIRGIRLFLESDMRQNNIPRSTYDYVLNILDKARS